MTFRSATIALSLLCSACLTASGQHRDPDTGLTDAENRIANERIQRIGREIAKKRAQSPMTLESNHFCTDGTSMRALINSKEAILIREGRRRLRLKALKANFDYWDGKYRLLLFRDVIQLSSEDKPSLTCRVSPQDGELSPNAVIN